MTLSSGNNNDDIDFLRENPGQLIDAAEKIIGEIQTPRYRNTSPPHFYRNAVGSPYSS